MYTLKSGLTRSLILLALAVGLLGYQFPPSETLSSGRGYSAREFGSIDSISDAVASVAKRAKKALVLVTVTHLGVAGRVWRGGGSGFFVDLDNGYIVTNAHVVDDPEYYNTKGKRIVATLANGEEREAIVTGTDESTDIAVLQVKNFSRAGLGRLTLGNSADLRTGDFVVALGAPHGLEDSVSFGIVSGLRRGNLGGVTALGNYIQTDAAINPGNSGGPLLNMQGEVVGVNTVKYGGSDNLGFAVPAEIVKKVMPQLVEKGKFERSYLGVMTQKLDAGLRDSFGVEYGEGGVIITAVMAFSPAAQAGLQVGDIIVAVEGQKVHMPSELDNAVAFIPPGKVIEVDYLKYGWQRSSVEVKLAAYTPKKTEETTTLWGLKIKESIHESGKSNLVVVESDNIKSNVRRMDTIVAVDNIEIQRLTQLKNYLQDKREVVLYLKRSEQFMFVTLHKQ